MDFRTFWGGIMLQPLCGYLLDVLELKVGLALLVIAWSLIAMLHGAAHSWRALAALRGLLGLTEGSANPAGLKASAEWFPAKERAFAAAYTTLERRWDQCSRLRWWRGPSSGTIGKQRSLSQGHLVSFGSLYG